VARVQGLALIGLQMQIEGGDLAATLQRLVQGVAELCQARVLLCRSGSSATLETLAASRDATPPDADSGEARLLAQALQATGALSYGGWLAMPVQRYGVTHGVLALQTCGSIDLGGLAGQIDPVVSALGSLLASAAPQAARPVDDAAVKQGNAPDAPVQASHPQVPATLLRTALRESGTFVWEWDLPTDALADIDEGAQMLGYGKHELGHTQRDWNRIIHPDDLALLEQAYEAHLRGECEVFEHVYRARAHDGSWRWVQERGRIVEWCADGSPRRMIGIQCDVSERMSQQVQQRELTERLRRIARQLPGVLMEYHQVPGRRGRFEFVSERSCELLGIAAADLMSDSLEAFGRVDQDDLAALLMQATRCAEQGTPLRADLRVAHAGNGQIRVRCHAQCQRLENGGAFWHAYVENVTAQYPQDTSSGSTAPPPGGVRAYSDFLTRMSHELRSPLNVAQGFTLLLLDDTVEPLSPSQRARLSRIHDAGEHLQAMLGDLLDLAHLDSVRLTLLTEPVPLTGLLQHCVELMRKTGERSGLQIRIGEAQALTVAADRLRVQQILLNLLGNAIKYNRPQGWVRLSCAASADGRHARIDVIDSGPGLSAEQQVHLFEPFNRLGREHGGIDGLGVGLALSRSLAVAMGGQVEVASVPGQGACFSLTLPLFQPPCPAQPS
jgi:PAS domain S-box-containing protein